MTPMDLKIILRVLMAFVAGMVIGFDREKSGKVAGMRTQMLVCVGSALLSAISIYIAEYYNITEPGVFKADPARLMAQIVSGIGFLGAGVIIKNGGNKVTGVTTAATIWTTAAVGISIGAGFYLPALVTTCLVLLLNPIAYFQYRSGLKSSYYSLIVPNSKRSLVEKAIKFLLINEKERKSVDGKISFVLLSSIQKNSELSKIFDEKNIRYELKSMEE
jgi:uncharacterized membrane protein YhiD involved in acid resistance